MNDFILQCEDGITGRESDKPLENWEHLERVRRRLKEKYGLMACKDFEYEPCGRRDLGYADLCDWMRHPSEEGLRESIAYLISMMVRKAPMWIAYQSSTPEKARYLRAILRKGFAKSDYAVGVDWLENEEAQYVVIQAFDHFA